MDKRSYSVDFLLDISLFIRLKLTRARKLSSFCPRAEQGCMTLYEFFEN
jgi:hypothetical protein